MVKLIREARQTTDDIINAIRNNAKAILDKLDEIEYGAKNLDDYNESLLKKAKTEIINTNSKLSTVAGSVKVAESFKRIKEARRGRHVVIRKGDMFEETSGDLRYIQIEGKHFNDYAVSIWKPQYDEDGELMDDLAYDHDAIFTAGEVRRLAKADSISYEE